MPPPFHIPVRSLQEATHEQVAILLVPGHFQTKLFIQSLDVSDFRSPKTWRPLNSDYSGVTMDYNGCEGHLMGILPLFFLFKLFSMEIENLDKTRVKFLVEIKLDLIP